MTSGPGLRELQAATRDLMSETDPGRVAVRTAGAASEILDLQEAAVYLRDGEGFSMAATAGDGQPADQPASPVRAAGPAGDGVDTPTGGGSGTAETTIRLGDHGVIAVTASSETGLTDDELRLASVLAANAEAALERSASERALRRERDDLAALFENIPDPTIETTMVDDEPIVERVNPAFEAVFGYDSGTIRGENVDEYIVPDDRVDEAARYNERVQAGDRFFGEVQRRTRDGRRDFILHVVAQDVDETETRGYAIYTDITEQKQRVRELERQNRRIEALHDVAQRMKAASDRAAVYEIVIDAAEEVLAFDLSLIDKVDGEYLVPTAISSGVSLSDYYEETPMDRETNLGAETARTGETFVVDDLRASRYAPANFEYRSALSVPLGEYGIFQAVATEKAAFSDADRQLAELLAEHAVAAIDRLARERELEDRAAALERQNERLDRFASVVSHDLRNPLSVARGRLDMARSSGDAEHFRTVERAHDRIDELVTGLLTLARRGDLGADPVPVDLENAAEEAWRTVETPDLALAVEDAPTLEADPERLRQLLENLVTNVVDHADGATTVTVGGCPDGFFVADDGSGIPPGERDAILESGHSGSEAGTGLGLAIVDTVAEAHGWTISIAASESGGARFEFTTAPGADDGS